MGHNVSVLIIGRRHVKCIERRRLGYHIKRDGERGALVRRRPHSSVQYIVFSSFRALVTRASGVI